MACALPHPDSLRLDCKPLEAGTCLPAPITLYSVICPLLTVRGLWRQEQFGSVESEPVTAWKGSSPTTCSW